NYIHNGNNSTEISFQYDGLGNRISKTIRNSNEHYKMQYARDAQGNVLAVYKYDLANNGYFLEENHIFGSSRLGLEEVSSKIETIDHLYSDYEHGIVRRIVGDKRYELTNHLGNVLSVISDRKIVGEITPEIDFES